MSETVSKIKKDIMKAKLSNRNLPSEEDQIRIRALTSFIGELERGGKIDDISEDDVIVKLKKVSKSLSDTYEKYGDVKLLEESKVLTEYCPQQLSHEEIESVLQDIDFSAINNINAAKGIAFKTMGSSGYDKSQYDSGDVVTVVNKLFKGAV